MLLEMQPTYLTGIDGRGGGEVVGDSARAGGIAIWYEWSGKSERQPLFVRTLIHGLHRAGNEENATIVNSMGQFQSGERKI